MNPADDDRAYLIALHTVDGLGSVRLFRLFEYFGEGKRIWEASDKELRELGISDKVISAVKQAKISLVPKSYFESSSTQKSTF
jgi:excinuclease UvrABC nuclease subunit